MISLARALVLAAAAAAPAEAAVTRYLTGNPADVDPQLWGPAHDLGGGGPDVDSAIQWLIDRVRGCSDCAADLDVVVLRASGGDGYNAPIYAMRGVDSVETLVITARPDANRADVEATVRNAEVVFFAGGDQCQYVQLFRGTRVERAVEHVYARGGGIGGTSAGAAIQGPFVYDACTGSVLSREALRNPYHAYVSFTSDFLRWGHFADVLVDTHFYERDRMGRLLAFLARHVQDGLAARVWGLGIDEGTSAVVDGQGRLRVLGDGYVYVILADHVPELCVPGRRLTYSGFRVWRVSAGQSFDLANRPSSGGYRVDVVNGVLSGNPY